MGRTPRPAYALKGIDLVVYSFFRHLGLEVKIRHVLDLKDPFWDDPDDREYDSEDKLIEPKEPKLVCTGLHSLKMDGEMVGDIYEVCPGKLNAGIRRTDSERVQEAIQSAWKSFWLCRIHWLNE